MPTTEKLAAFQLVNGRTVIGMASEKLAESLDDGEQYILIDDPYEFAFVRNNEGRPAPSMMPYTVIPHVGSPVKQLKLWVHHQVSWEFVDKDIEALYTYVVSGIQVAPASALVGK
jgi:hypothetical protein